MSRSAKVFIVLLVTFPFWGQAVYWGYRWVSSKYEVRSECESQIVFYPATESVSGTSGWTDKQGESEHYVWGSGLLERKFKTKGEAIAYCIGYKN